MENFFPVLSFRNNSREKWARIGVRGWDGPAECRRGPAEGVEVFPLLGWRKSLRLHCETKMSFLLFIWGKSAQLAGEEAAEERRVRRTPLLRTFFSLANETCSSLAEEGLEGVFTELSSSWSFPSFWSWCGTQLSRAIVSVGMGIFYSHIFIKVLP